MRALTRWLNPLASSEALVVLHQAMRSALHRRIRMVVKMVVNLPAFCVASISLLDNLAGTMEGGMDYNHL